MKIYVAARFHEKERVQKIYTMLKSIGHKITDDWTQCTLQKPYDSHLANAQECASHAIAGVQEADIFIFLTNPEIGAGSSAELGAALLSNQLRGFPAIYSVGLYRENNLMLYHPAVKQFDTIEDLLVFLESTKPVALKKHIFRPRIGIGVLALNNQNKILLGKRKNAHGSGDWAPPGGHLEFGETPIQCAKRELLEEAGLELLSPKELSFTNDMFTEEGKHYITVFVEGKIEGDPQILEPDKCSEWKWFDWGDLPYPLFLPFNNLLLKKQLSIIIP